MAERGVSLSNGHWVREVRHRDEQGHQTAILTTDFVHSMEKVVAALDARWCQENFFRYMMEHYSLDRLAQYGAQPLPDTSRLRTESKQFIDTLKRIAYRAETLLLRTARQKLQRTEDARAWIRQVLQSPANLIPNPADKILTVQIHPLTNPVHNQALKELCTQLTETETIHPNTDFRLIFEFLGPA